MARDYKPLVQMSFRCTEEKKNKILDMAKSQGKNVSKYISDRLEDKLEENVAVSQRDDLVKIIKDIFVYMNMSDPISNDPKELLENLLYLVQKKKIIYKK